MSMSRTRLSTPSLYKMTGIAPSSFITANACFEVNSDPTRYALDALFIAFDDFMGKPFT